MSYLTRACAAITFACLITEAHAIAQEGESIPVEDSTSVVAAPELAPGNWAESEAQARASENPYTGNLLTRYRLSGDWWGARSGLADRGLTFDFFADPTGLQVLGF